MVREEKLINRLNKEEQLIIVHLNRERKLRSKEPEGERSCSRGPRGVSGLASLPDCCTVGPPLCFPGVLTAKIEFSCCFIEALFCFCRSSESRDRRGAPRLTGASYCCRVYPCGAPPLWRNTISAASPCLGPPWPHLALLEASFRLLPFCSGPSACIFALIPPLPASLAVYMHPSILPPFYQLQLNGVASAVSGSRRRSLCCPGGHEGCRSFRVFLGGGPLPGSWEGGPPSVGTEDGADSRQFKAAICKPDARPERL